MKQIIQDKCEGKWGRGCNALHSQRADFKKRPLAHSVICHESLEDKGSFYMHLAET